MVATRIPVSALSRLSWPQAIRKKGRVFPKKPSPVNQSQRLSVSRGMRRPRNIAQASRISAARVRRTKMSAIGGRKSTV